MLSAMSDQGRVSFFRIPVRRWRPLPPSWPVPSNWRRRAGSRPSVKQGAVARRLRTWPCWITGRRYVPPVVLRPAAEPLAGTSSRPPYRPRQRVVSGDDFETSLPELEKHGGGVRVGPVVEGSVLFPGVQVHHGEFGLPGRHPAEVGGAGVTPHGARRAPRCSIAGGSAIGTAALPAPLHVAPSRRCILSLLATAVRLECGTGKAERRAVEGRGGSTPDTALRGPSLGVFLPVALLAPGPAGGCMWTPLRQACFCRSASTFRIRPRQAVCARSGYGQTAGATRPTCRRISSRPPCRHGISPWPPPAGARRIHGSSSGPGPAAACRSAGRHCPRPGPPSSCGSAAVPPRGP